MKRREFIAKCGAGLAGIITAGKAPAAIVKSMLGANGADFIISKESDFPYVTKGLIAMWDGEWNAGYGIHDPNATVWKNLVQGSPFGDGERTGTGLSTKLPIWTDRSCYSPEVYTLHNRKACFNVSATFLDTQSVVCGETVVRTRNATEETQGWNSSAAIGCDVRLNRNYSGARVEPCAVFKYTDTQFQAWQCSAGVQETLDPSVTRSYHVRRVGINQLGIRVNEGIESIGGKGNGFTSSITNTWPLAVTNQTVVEVFCIRYYNRNLSAAEINHNYKIDKERFGL